MGFSGAGSAAGLALQASTGLAGFTLVNATPTILTWTAPNDGNLHRILLFAQIDVTVAETGGQITFTATAPDSTGISKTVIGAGLGTGVQFPISSSGPQQIIIKPGTTFTLLQNSALTAGAAVFWAEIWGS